MNQASYRDLVLELKQFHWILVIVKPPNDSVYSHWFAKTPETRPTFSKAEACILHVNELGYSAFTK